MTTAVTTEGCTCPLAGRCERHNMTKGPTLHKHCQTNYKGYRDHWDRRAAKTSRGLGDTVAKVLESTGVAAIVNKIAGTPGGCQKCKRRQRRLNKMFPYKKR